MKIGLMGGTFDPIHNAHLRVAGEVRERLGLDRVVFIPTGNPWLRRAAGTAPAADRLEMVKLAIAEKPYFEVSSVEVDRHGPTYTIDTLTELKQGRYRDDDLYFIMGWDTFEQMPRWRRPAPILDLCRLVVVPRPGYPPPDLKNMEIALPGLSQKVTMLDSPQMEESASEIRRRVAQGLPLSDLVPPPVEDYIKKHKLYVP